MKIRFDRPEDKPADAPQGVKLPYAPAKRAISAIRWWIVVLAVSSPMIYLLVKLGQTILFTTAVGVINMDKVAINAGTESVVADMRVTVGQDVEQGALLMLLNDPKLGERKVRVDSEISLLQTELATATGRLTRLEAAIVSAQRNLSIQRDSLHRVNRLFTAGAATAAELDQARTQAAVAEQALAVARAEQETALTVSKNVVAEARLEGLKSEQTAVTQEIARLRVQAPVSGRVLDIFVTQGQALGPGTPLLSLGQPERVDVLCFLDPASLIKVAAGDKVTIRFADGRHLPGVVSQAPNLARRTPTELAGMLTEARQSIIVHVAPTEEIPDWAMVDGLPLQVSFGLNWPF